MGLRLPLFARLALAAALVALTAACVAPTAAPVSPTPSPTLRSTATSTQPPTATRTPAPSATASQTATPTRTPTKTVSAGPSATPTEAGVGATLPLVYKFLNNCTSDYGVWHISIFGPEETVVDVPLGETVAGELPPGQYTLFYLADNGTEDGPFGFFSDDGPVNESMCPEEN